MTLNTLNKFVLDCLFPIKCLGCGREDEWICSRCCTNIKLITEHPCGICEKVLTPFGQTCHSCKSKSQLDGFISAVSYQEPIIGQAIHYYKYQFIKNLDRSLAHLLIKAIKQTELPLPDLVIPVPLHKRRLRWRGFNQSEILAKLLAENLAGQLQLECRADILERKRFTLPQMKIKNYKFRQKNLKDAFKLDSTDVQNKTVMLVDDVATTGSTILECAKVLKNAGAREVWAVVIARQEVSDEL